MREWTERAANLGPRPIRHWEHASRLTVPPSHQLLTPELILHLQRTAGNAAVSGLLCGIGPQSPPAAWFPTGPRTPAAERPSNSPKPVQRAVIALGTDNATKACLQNLSTGKRYTGASRLFRKLVRLVGVSMDLGGGALRGNVEGPAEPADIGTPLAEGFMGEDESLYILGHGSLENTTVVDLSPEKMAKKLKRKWWPRRYSGKIKMVACHSATQSPPSGTIPFAQGLAAALKPGAGDTFRPQSVDGIVGIGWVDEKTGSMMSIDVDTYRNQLKAKQKEKFKVQGREKRARELKKIFKRYPGAVTRGKTGKRRYPVEE